MKNQSPQTVAFEKVYPHEKSLFHLKRIFTTEYMPSTSPLETQAQLKIDFSQLPTQELQTSLHFQFGNTITHIQDCLNVHQASESQDDSEDLGTKQLQNSGQSTLSHILADSARCESKNQKQEENQKSHIFYLNGAICKYTNNTTQRIIIGEPTDENVAHLSEQINKTPTGLDIRLIIQANCQEIVSQYTVEILAHAADNYVYQQQKALKMNAENNNLLISEQQQQQIENTTEAIEDLLIIDNDSTNFTTPQKDFTTPKSRKHPRTNQKGNSLALAQMISPDQQFSQQQQQLQNTNNFQNIPQEYSVPIQEESLISENCEKNHRKSTLTDIANLQLTNNYDNNGAEQENQVDSQDSDYNEESSQTYNVIQAKKRHTHHSRRRKNTGSNNIVSIDGQIGRKSDKKNVVKNFVKAFRGYLCQWGEESEIMQLFKLESKNDLNKTRKEFLSFEAARKYNNRLIKELLHDCYYKNAFIFFLEMRAKDWLMNSGVQDKKSHKEVLAQYIKAAHDEDQLEKIVILKSRQDATELI